MNPARRRALIWIILGALVLLALAGGLDSFTFQPGKNFAFQAPAQPVTGAVTTTLPGGEVIMLIFRGILAILLILLPVSVIYSLVNKEGRKRLIANIALVLLAYLLSERMKDQAQVEVVVTPPPINLSPGLNLPAIGGEPLPPLPPAPSEGLVLVASIVLVMVGIALAVWLGRRWLFPPHTAPLELIAKEAERARDELEGGHGIEDAIVRTYRQMNKIVAEARELRRPDSATPREFEETLVEEGLPSAPLETLTRLFEDVRYGGLVAGPAERQKAIDSLSAIAAACRAGSPGGRAQAASARRI